MKESAHFSRKNNIHVFQAFSFQTSAENNYIFHVPPQFTLNKKVLLRERKRHTRSAFLSPAGGGGGGSYTNQPDRGVPPSLDRGVTQGTPPPHVQSKYTSHPR